MIDLVFYYSSLFKKHWTYKT